MYPQDERGGEYPTRHRGSRAGKLWRDGGVHSWCGRAPGRHG